MTHHVLFLHGWTMQGAIFEDVVNRLGPEFDCFAPDLPGHGANVGLTPSLESAAALVHAYLHRWHDQKVIAVGWSMGAAVLWRYIEHFGTKGLAALVTVDMSPKISPAPDWPHGLLGQTEASVQSSYERFKSEWNSASYGIAATMFSNDYQSTSFTRDDARRRIMKNRPETMAAMWKNLTEMDARAVISKIDIPYLVCSGAKSRVYPASASDWIVRNAPNATQHVFGNSGHSPHIEEPAAFAALIKLFARRV